MNSLGFKLMVSCFFLTLSSCYSQTQKQTNSNAKKDTVIETNENMYGQVIMTTAYVNGIMNGPYKMYYDDGTLSAEGNHVNGKIFGTVKSYTPEGKLAKIEVWDTAASPYLENKIVSRLVEEIVFW